jgi:hypothetical protein
LNRLKIVSSYVKLNNSFLDHNLGRKFFVLVYRLGIFKSEKWEREKAYRANFSWSLNIYRNHFLHKNQDVLFKLAQKYLIGRNCETFGSIFRLNYLIFSSSNRSNVSFAYVQTPNQARTQFFPFCAVFG